MDTCLHMSHPYDNIVDLGIHYLLKTDEVVSG